jgi:hypothetical protein
MSNKKNNKKERIEAVKKTGEETYLGKAQLTQPSPQPEPAQPTWPIPIRIVVILLPPGSSSVATPWPPDRPPLWTHEIDATASRGV